MMEIKLNKIPSDCESSERLVTEELRTCRRHPNLGITAPSPLMRMTAFSLCFQFIPFQPQYIGYFVRALHMVFRRGFQFCYCGYINRILCMADLLNNTVLFFELLLEIILLFLTSWTFFLLLYKYFCWTCKQNKLHQQVHWVHINRQDVNDSRKPTEYCHNDANTAYPLHRCCQSFSVHIHHIQAWTRTWNERFWLEYRSWKATSSLYYWIEHPS